LSALYLYDDARARTFEPFASSRPISELVSGISTIRERWQTALQGVTKTHFLAGRRHADFDEWSQSLPADATIPAGAIVVNARAVPGVPADIVKLGRYNAGCSVWRCGERLAGIRGAAEDGFARLRLDRERFARKGGLVEYTDTLGHGAINWHYISLSYE